MSKPWRCSEKWGGQVVATTALAFGIWCVSMVSLMRTGRSDTSIVDKLWSLQPPAYCFHLAMSSRSPRLWIMTALATLWGARLTYNFYVKGGYTKASEDYRWTEVRSWFPHLWQFEVVNFVFVCFWQELLLLAIAAPAAVVYESTTGDASYFELILLSGLFLAFFAIECIADRQQWNFQREKHRRLQAGEDLNGDDHGFIVTGLWAWSRHPNYAAEVAMWWVFYMFSISDGGLVNSSILGPLLLTMLFAAPGASADLTEDLSSRKYCAAYEEYQRRVPKLLPFRMDQAARFLYIIYFASHIPITIFIDAQAVVPASFFPTTPRLLLHWHVTQHGDFLMLSPPLWFQTLVCAELLLQLPFFFFALRAFLTRSEHSFASLFHIYAAHVVTTMLPILASFAVAPNTSFPSPDARSTLLALYAPYLLIPLSLFLYFPPPLRRSPSRDHSD